VRRGKRVGVTRAFNFYLCGGPLIPSEKKLTIVDSPGYGDRGTEEMGDLFQSYIMKRSNLKLILLLVDAGVGMNRYDRSMLEFLLKIHHEHRPDVDIQPVMSKLDKVSHHTTISRLGRTVEDIYRIAPAARQPYILVGCKGHTKSFGIEETRAQILLGSGLSSLRPRVPRI